VLGKTPRQEKVDETIDLKSLNCNSEFWA